MLPTPRSRFAEHCTAVLEQALEGVSAYRSWRPFDQGPVVSIDDRFAALPMMTKKAMRSFSPAAFAAPGRSMEEAMRRGEIELVSTSGTTEDQILNIWYQPWWDASERASWSLNAHAQRVATGTHPEAILSNPRNVGIPSERELTFEQRRLGRFLYLNEQDDPLSWTDSLCERMLSELERLQPVLLEANPSLLSRLCRWALRARRRPFRPRLIVLTYEYPSLIHRRHIQAVFDTPVMSSYGTTESGYVFVECEHGRLHQNVASCRVDFLPFRARHGGPSLGQLLITPFDNPWRILLRFDGGDLGRLETGHCPCGRSEGLTLTSLEGRAVNLTTTTEGRLTTQGEIDRRLSEIPEIQEYQLRQTAAASYRLLLDCGTELSPRVRERAREVLYDTYGRDAHVLVEESSALPPEPSGKYRLVKPLFPVDSWEFVEPRARPPSPLETI